MLYQTYVQISSGNIKSNLKLIRQIVGEQRKILIAVKANAYGHGIVQVARLAEISGIDWLGIATVPEGIKIRNGGINLPILKFSPPFPEEMPACIQYKLSPTVCEYENIKVLQKICDSMHKVIDVHLKVDTGMGRIGAKISDAPVLAKFIETECPNLSLGGIFTHLPSSSEIDKTYTDHQILSFKVVVNNIQEIIGRKVEIAHCSNSAGVLGYESSLMDMVRPGIIAYGLYPSYDIPRDVPLKPALSFFSRVSFIKQVEAGASIGYDRSWIAPCKTMIATISVGYADGFNRLFSNRGRVLIHGHSFPIVGKVCMDQSMINLGHHTDIQVGDEVVLIGRSGAEEITCEDWAQVLDTIPYEITSQINSRVERIYVQ